MINKLYKNIVNEVIYGTDCVVLDDHTIEKFLDETNVLNELKGVQGVYSDEGLYDFFPNFSVYKRVSKEKASAILGWPIVNYILNDKALSPRYDWSLVGNSRYSRADSVSYGGAITAGIKSPDKLYQKEMERIVKTLGWKIIKWMGVGANRKSQVVIIPSFEMDTMSAKLNENACLTIKLKESMDDITIKRGLELSLKNAGFRVKKFKKAKPGYNEIWAGAFRTKNSVMPFSYSKYGDVFYQGNNIGELNSKHLLNYLKSIKDNNRWVESIMEKITKVGDEYVVYAKSGGKRLGTHKSKKKAQAQLRAIEFSKSKRKSEEFGADPGLLPSPSRKGIKRAKKRKDRSIYSEEEKSIDTIIAVYPGRFQPFGPHHEEVYEQIRKKFKEVFIATSNKSGGDRHPMNFSQKKKHMQKMGVNGSAIVLENQPYIPKGLLKKFDGESTAVVFVVGAKDKGRLTAGKYFKEYEKNYMRLEGHEKHGYIMEAPHVSVRVGGQEIDGTTIRKLLGSEKYDLDIKKKFFKKMFGYFDQKTFDLFVNSFAEGLILEGGAYGHMAHPFDDYELTFGDLKSIIDQGLQGQLDKEESVTEKLDGQNIMVSVVDGEARAARNKGNLKSGGMTLDDVKNKFKHHIPTVRGAFVYSMTDLKSSLERMSKKDQETLFDNGKNWANIEIIYPDTKNVIDYDGGMQIILHGILKYNEAWTPSGEVKGGGKKLATIINKLNKGIQTKFAFKGPNVLKIAKAKDYSKKRQKYFGVLKKLQDIYKLKDTDEVSLYHQHFWLEYILAGANSTDFSNIPDNILYPLMKRWAFSDKSYKMTDINKLKGDHPGFVDWVRTTEKLDHVKMLKENMRPFEVLFFEVGAEILSNVSNWLAPNPDQTVQKLRKDLDGAVKSILSKKDSSSIAKLKAQLSKINSMGDLSNLVPSEGLVFKYNDKVYKFTGYFAPINQITGLMKFSR